jgi:hypothetical protein
MGTDERERIAIAPGGTLELFEKLGISGTGRDDDVKAAWPCSYAKAPTGWRSAPAPVCRLAAGIL